MNLPRRGIHLAILMAVLSYLPGLTACISAEEYRKFQSTSGELIEAKIIKFGRGMVDIQRSDGTSFRVPLERFSTQDQEYIQQYQRLNQFRLDENWNVWLTTRTISRSTEKMDFSAHDVNTLIYTIRIKKSPDTSLSGYEFRYIIFIDRDETGNDPSVMAGSLMTSEENGTEVILKTSPFPLNKIYLLPNSWWTRKKKAYEDKTIGILLRIYLENEVVYEKSAPLLLSTKQDWDSAWKLAHESTNPDIPRENAPKTKI